MTDGEALGAMEATELELARAEAIVVEVGGAEFGLDVRHVLEVSHVPPITRLPFAPPALPGVVSLRGAVLPLFDLRQRLFGSPGRRDGRMVIASDPKYNSDIAILVDRVIDMIPLTSALEPPSPEIAASVPDGLIVGVMTAGENRSVTMLDLTAVLERPQSESEDDR